MKKSIFFLGLIVILGCSPKNGEAGGNDAKAEKAGWYTENIQQATMTVNFAPFDGDVEFFMFYTSISDWMLSNDTTDIMVNRIDATKQYTLSELDNVAKRVFAGDQFNANNTRPFHFSSTDLPLTFRYPERLQDLTYGSNDTMLFRDETYIDTIDRLVPRRFYQTSSWGRERYNIFLLAYKTSSETKYNIKFLNLATIRNNPIKFFE